MTEDEEFEALEQRLNYKPTVKESKQTQALKLALEALNRNDYLGWQTNIHVRQAIREALAEESSGTEQPEFITHSVEQPYDWSEWVCPDPKSYLMKCCDCGLVHEAQFGVVRYKSEIEREDCDMVDDPNLQAVFRMRRSEQWSPEDTAHRAGGLPMEQPAQQQGPVAWVVQYAHDHKDIDFYERDIEDLPVGTKLYTSLQPSKPWVGLTPEERDYIWHTVGNSDAHGDVDGWSGRDVMDAIEAKLREKNA